MTARDLLNEAAQLGLHIISDGGNLRIRPGRLCPPDFASLLRTHKAELLELLAKVNAAGASELVTAQTADRARVGHPSPDGSGGRSDHH